MHAVIIVADKMEEAVYSMVSDDGGKIMKKCCPCIKNSSINQAKKLIRYLRNEAFLEKKDITFLRHSKYSAREILDILSYITCLHQGGDLLIYYSGHGGITKWAFNNYLGEYIRYCELENLFRGFSGSLVVINECCHALAIHPHLRRAMKKRYLLFGSSRKNKMGESNLSVLDSILGAWILRKRAEPRVIGIGRDDERDTMDFCAERSFPRIFFLSLCRHDCCPRIERIPLSEQPSLRRGDDLDHIWFSK